MFLKSLIIKSGDGNEIRNIKFHNGLNLIVDETPIKTGKETGNNVGKTTVLKLIDFCLGSTAKSIYSDTEHSRNEYKAVKDFLISKRVAVELVLKGSLTQVDSPEVKIDRNFLARKDRIQRINGQDKTDEEFDRALTELLFPGHFGRKPTFRQAIAHNIRYQDLSISNTLKNLDPYTRADEYETLYLFLFGCNFHQGDAKQLLRTEIKLEEKFKARLETEQTKAGYEAALGILEVEIQELEATKAKLNINPDFEKDLNTLNQVKYQVNLTSSEISRLELRKNLVVEAEKEIKSGSANIDLNQLRELYSQATALVTGIQKSFEDLTDFHNQMVESKIRFITKDLPSIDQELAKQRTQLTRLLTQESNLSQIIIQKDAFVLLDKVVGEINSKYQMKGRYEHILKQLWDVDSKLTDLNKRLDEIDDELFSEGFTRKIKEQLSKFNRFFSEISSELYGEKYALKVDTKSGKDRRLYEFSAFNLNFSSGKKQGEIVCFDIAYTLFADSEGIPCMHFLLNDKKELMHDNQLLMIAKLVEARGIQFVASILKDKLPPELNKDEHIVLKLSQDDKLFKIEKMQ